MESRSIKPPLTGNFTITPEELPAPSGQRSIKNTIPESLPAKVQATEEPSSTTLLSKRQCSSLTTGPKTETGFITTTHKELETLFENLFQEALNLKEKELRDSILKFLTKAFFDSLGQIDKAESFAKRITSEYAREKTKKALFFQMFGILFSSDQESEILKAKLSEFEETLAPYFLHNGDVYDARRQFAIALATTILDGPLREDKLIKSLELLAEFINKMPRGRDRFLSKKAVAPIVANAVLLGRSSLQEIEQGLDFIEKYFFNTINNPTGEDPIWDIITSTLAKTVFACDCSREGIKKGIDFLEEKFLPKIIGANFRDKMIYRQAMRETIACVGAKFVFSGKQSLETIKDNLMFFVREFIAWKVGIFVHPIIFAKAAPHIAKLALTERKSLESFKEALAFLERNVFVKITDEYTKSCCREAVTPILAKAIFKDVGTDQSVINERLDFINKNFLTFIEYKEIRKTAIEIIIVRLAKELLRNMQTLTQIREFLFSLNNDTIDKLTTKSSRDNVRGAIAINLAKDLFTRPENSEQIFRLLKAHLLNHIKSDFTRKRATKSAYQDYYKQKLIQLNVLDKVKLLANKSTEQEDERISLQPNPEALEVLLT